MEMVVPMNTGAEAVETAIKVVRRWGYTVKGVPDDHASIIVCTGNFHGRTTTIAGFSSDPGTRSGFGPFTPGFVSVPFGDAYALSDAITDTTVAILLEPIRRGRRDRPPTGTFRTSADSPPSAASCSSPTRSSRARAPGGPSVRSRAGQARSVPGREGTGRWDRAGLGGGRGPAMRSGALPGTHGSTFGGNPLACARA
jgi:ornithine--oxo-acid transaminase